MNGIYHKVGIRVSSNDVYKAVTTQSGLANWWTKQVEGDFSSSSPQLGEKIRFGFGEFWMEMQILEFKPGSLVVWECKKGPEEWIGSHIEFSLSTAKSGDMTILYFRHRDWKIENESTAHCSMKWAIFLLSLKEFLEKGSGRPSPDDIKIDDLN
jgi:uncharacterized protein YndB with AHSA1/START domain